MTCPYCDRVIERYQRPYETGGVKYHDWCYQARIMRETREETDRAAGKSQAFKKIRAEGAKEED